MSSKVVIGAAAGVILGLLAGLFLGGAIQPGPAAPAIQGGNIARLPEQAPPPPEPLQNPPPTEVAPRTLRDFIAETKVPPVPRGEGEITGTVMTPDGKPVAGVVVSASTSYPEPRYRPGLSAEERIERDIRYARWQDVATHKTATDEQGHYRIAGLAADAEYDVSGRADGWRIENQNPKQRRVKPDGVCHLLARSEALVAVHVTMADGTPAEDATVVYRAQALSREQSATAWNGPAELRLTPGEWTLYAVSKDHWYAPDRLQYRSSEVTLTIEEGATVAPLTLVLMPTPSIGGFIQLPKGFERLPVDVFLQPDPPGGPPSEAMYDIKGTTEARVWSNGDQFQWQCSNLAGGPWRVLLVTEQAVVDWADVSLVGDRAQCNLELPAPTTDDYIALRVFSPEGELLRDVEIGMDAHSTGGSHGYGPQQLVDEEGRIWLRRNPRGEDVEYEWFQIRVSHTKHGEKVVRYEAESREVMDIHLQTPGWLVLTVPGWDDMRGKGVLTWQLWRQDMDGRGARMVADDDGQRASPIRLGPVSPGEYKLELTLRVDTFDNVDLVERQVTLVSGDNYLTESAPELHPLTIRPAEGQKLPSIELVAAPGKLHCDLRRGSRDADNYEISHVPAGTYRLVSSTGEMKITISGPSDVVFAPRPFDCFELTVRPEGGRLEQLGLKDGDKLIEIDGQAFTPDAERSNLLNETITKESTTWVVLRGGVRTAVTFDGRELFKILTDRQSEERERFHMEPGYRE
ncbi:MAG: carboxypeptidase-like regulatory domain-containing protein [Planctomycetes bacterium]|nr:carboxypeptidase-like regulatory domain-containing protein [Planctomycetota bacterium]